MDTNTDTQANEQTTNSTTNDASTDVKDDVGARLQALENENKLLRDEATSQRKLKQKLAEEVNTLKKGVKEGDETSNDAKYKSLYEQEKQRADSYLNSVKKTQIQNELTAKLSKAGIRPDLLNAGIKLTDVSMIEWDLENGVDEGSVEAAIHHLKSQHSGFFENVVKPTTTKSPARNVTSDSKVITRKEFNALPLPERSLKMSEGYSLID